MLNDIHQDVVTDQRNKNIDKKRGRGIYDSQKIIAVFLYSKWYILIISFGKEIKRREGGSFLILKIVLQIYVN